MKRSIHAMIEVHAPIGYEDASGFHIGVPRPNLKRNGAATPDRDSILRTEQDAARGATALDDALALRGSAHLPHN